MPLDKDAALGNCPVMERLRSPARGPWGGGSNWDSSSQEWKATGPPTPAAPAQMTRSISLSPEPAPLSQPSIRGPNPAPTQHARGPPEIWIWLLSFIPCMSDIHFPFLCYLALTEVRT